MADLNAGGPARAVFFTDADLNSGNVILTAPVNSGPGTITLAPGATIGFSVFASDNYFTGNATDAIEGMRFTPGLARFGVVGDPFGTVGRTQQRHAGRDHGHAAGYDRAPSSAC